MRTLLALIIALMIFPIANAVLIDGLQTSVTHNSATFTFTTTETADTVINYGNNTLKSQTITDESFVTDHSITITGLNEATTYYYDIISTTQTGSQTIKPGNFRTADITPPPKVSGFEIGEITRTSVELDWENVAVSDFEIYLIYRDGANIANTTALGYTDEDLQSGTTYIYELAAMDESNNIGENSDPLTVTTLEPDTIAPVISNLSIIGMTDTTANIVWQTDEEATSFVSYDSMSKDDDTYVIDHSLTMDGLVKDMSYTYYVKSCDVDGNCAESEERTFTAGADFIPPFINVTVPSKYNQLSIDFNINTEPMAYITVYVNEVWKRSGRADSEGSIKFNDVSLTSILAVNTVRFEAVDDAGNEYQETFDIELDFVTPEFVLSTNISTISRQRILTIHGYVSEESLIQIFIDLEPFDTNPPEKVIELESQTGSNDVDLSWKKSEADDFDYYLVYRNGELVAITNQNRFNDNKVNPGTIYKYWVAAVDEDCLKGPQSDVFEAKTQEGGEIIDTSHGLIIASCDVNLPEKEVVTSGQFSEKINLKNGINNIKILVIDMAGNVFEYNTMTIFDTKAPKIVRTNLRDLNPSYSKDITVIGEIDEPATVYVYINDETSPSYSTQTDNNGLFSLDIELSKEKSIGKGDERKWENTVKLVVVDLAGLNDTEERKINFARCGVGSDWIVSTRNIWPTEILPGYIVDGTAQFNLIIDLLWTGAGEEPEQLRGIPRVKLLHLSIEEKQHYDEEFLKPIVLPAPGADYKKFTIQVGINKINPEPRGENWTMLEKENNISARHKEDCGSGGVLSAPIGNFLDRGCIRAPLELSLRYRCEKVRPDGILNKNANCEQKQCIFANVWIDKRIPPNINKGFLKGMIKTLNTTVNIINATLEPLRTASKIAFAGCGVMWVAWWGKKSTEVFSCSPGIFSGNLAGALAAFDLDTSCGGICRINFDGKVECDGSEDDQVKQKCESCLGSRLNTLKVEKVMNNVCDRVLCPAVPSFDKYVKDEQRDDKSVCSGYSVDYTTSVDQWNTGDPDNKCRICELLPESKACKELPKNKCCPIKYKNKWQAGAVFMNEMKESACMDANSKIDSDQKKAAKKDFQCTRVGDFMRGVRDFKLCKEDISNRVSIPDCIQVRGTRKCFNLVLERNDKTAPWDRLYLEFENPMNYHYDDGTIKTKPHITTDDLSGVLSKVKLICEKFIKGEIRDSSIDWPMYNPQSIIEEVQGFVRTSSFEPRSLDWDAKFDDTGNIIIQSLIDDKKEYVYNKKTDSEGNIFYSSNEKYYSPNGTEVDENGKIISGGSKDVILGNEEKGVLVVTLTSLNPNQLNIFKSPQPIPQSMVSLICEGTTVKKDYIIDPPKGLMKSAQSVCLSGLTSYLGMYKQLLQMMQGCFNKILITGDGSAGACQEYVSKYTCDIVYKALSCASQGESFGTGARVEGGITGFGKYMADSMRDVQRSIKNRYGSTNMFKVMFVDRKVVHSMCQMMFGVDTDFSFDALLELGAEMPVDPIVIPQGGERRFISYDANTGFTTHQYELPLIIVPGGDMNYRVKLICSNDYSCDPYDGYPKDGRCDCADDGVKCTRDPISGGCVRTVTRHFGDGRMSRGETLYVAPNDIITNPTSYDNNYRYDKIVVEYDMLVGQAGRVSEAGTRPGGVKSAPIHLVGGGPPAGSCWFRFGAVNPGFKCGIDYAETGLGYFVSPHAGSKIIVKKSDNEPYCLDETISIPDYVIKTQGKDKYGNAMPVFLVADLRNQRGISVVNQEQYFIPTEGYHNFGGTTPFNFTIDDYYFDMTSGFNQEIATTTQTSGGCKVFGKDLSSIPESPEVTAQVTDCYIPNEERYVYPHKRPNTDWSVYRKKIVQGQADRIDEYICTEQGDSDTFILYCKSTRIIQGKEEIIEEFTLDIRDYGVKSGNQYIAIRKKSTAQTATTTTIPIANLNWDWPIGNPRITSCFGNRTMANQIEFHQGIDLDGENKIKAIADGIVEKVNTGCSEGVLSCGDGLGNYVIINHNGWYVIYGHLAEGTIKVEESNSIEQGDEISEKGSTGRSTDDHLHLGIYPFSDVISNYKTQGINPLCFFDKDTANNNAQNCDDWPGLSSGWACPTSPSDVFVGTSGMRDCKTKAQPWTVSLSLHPIKKVGLSEEPDLSTPINYDGKDQVITFKFNAKCVACGGQTTSTETTIQPSAAITTSTNIGTNQSNIITSQVVPPELLCYGLNSSGSIISTGTVVQTREKLEYRYDRDDVCWAYRVKYLTIIHGGGVSSSWTDLTCIVDSNKFFPDDQTTIDVADEIISLNETEGMDYLNNNVSYSGEICI